MEKNQDSNMLKKSLFRRYKVFILSVAIALSSIMYPHQTLAQNYDKPIELLGLKIDLKFCQQFDKIAGIVSSFQNINIPIFPGGGVSIAGLAASNPVLDVCEFITTLRNLTLTDLLFGAADFLNEMLGNQYTEGLNFTRNLYDLSTVFINEDGKLRASSQILTRRSSRNLNRFYKNNSGYINKKLGTSLDSRTREKTQRDLSRMSRLTFRRSLNEETMKCPKPKSTGKDYGDLYVKEVVPQEQNLDRFEAYVNFYNNSLLQMGAKINEDEKELIEYVGLVNKVLQKTYRFNIQVVNTKIASTEMVPIEADPDDPTAPRSEEKETFVDKKYQTFCGAKGDPDNLTGPCALLYDPVPLEALVEKYTGRWKAYTIVQASKTTKGILDNPIGRVENEFRDNSIICNRGRLRDTLNRQDPNFQENLQKKYDECVATQEMKMAKAGNLLAFYATELANWRRQYLTADAHIKTFESFYLGNFYTVDERTEEDAAGSYAQTETKCAPLRNLGAINAKMAETLAINAEVNQMLVEQTMQINMLEQEKERRRKEEVVKAERRRALAAERERRRKVDYNQFVTFPTLNGI